MGGEQTGVESTGLDVNTATVPMPQDSMKATTEEWRSEQAQWRVESEESGERESGSAVMARGGRSTLHIRKCEPSGPFQLV